MATYTKYDTAIEKLCDKKIDAFGTTDVWKAVIHTDAPVTTTDSTLTDLVQIAGTNGYTTGGTSITFNSTRTGGTIMATGTDVVWTASGGNLGASTTGRYISVYNDTSAADDLWCSWDYGSVFTIADGETLTLDFGVNIWSMT